MAVLLATRDGVWLADLDGSVDRLCDAGKVYDVARAGDRVLAAAASGLFLADGVAGDWGRVELPADHVTATAATPDGERLFTGTRPARLFCSDDGGTSWSALSGFSSLPSAEHWWNPDVTPHVRAIETHREAPDRVVAGVDGGGVHVSDDRGATWAERCSAVAGFVHDVRAIGPDHWVAATDAGLFRTRDAGGWWDYLYGDEMAHRYFRGVALDGEVVYAGGARSHPPVWTGDLGADAALYRLDLAERTPDLAVEPYPGEPQDLVLSGAVVDGFPVAGTNEGWLLVRERGSWEPLLEVPGNPQVRNMLPV